MTTHTVNAVSPSQVATPPRWATWRHPMSWRPLSATKMSRCRDWFENAKRITALTVELETVSLVIARSTEVWD